MALMQDLFGGGESQVFGAPFFEQNFGRGGRLAQQQLPQVQQIAQPLAQQLGGQGQTLLNQIQGSADLLTPFADPGYGQQQLAGLTSLVNQNFSENILPSIKRSALGSGQLGGSMQTDLLLRGARDAVNTPLFQQGGNILQAERALSQSAAQGVGQLQNVGGVGGLSQLGNLFNLQAVLPFAAEFGPLQQMAGLLGNPVTTQSSQGGIIPGLAGLAGGLGEFGKGAAALGL